MEPRIEFIHERKLIGMKLTMSFSNYRIAELWKSFMPRRNEIKNNLNQNLISLGIYQPDYFVAFHPENEFERWAAVEVSDFLDIPNEMYPLVLPQGKYAVFLHKGNSNEFAKTFQYIMNTWLPNSIYTLDYRPHFELLDERYKNNDPSSEEEIWIPIKEKNANDELEPKI